MKKAAVIGICGYSVFLKDGKLPKTGESSVFKTFHTEVGGKGVNAAAAIKILGGEVSFLTALGRDDEGAKCKEFFKRVSLKTTICEKSANTDYGVILVGEGGENCVSVYAGASNLLNADDAEGFKAEIESADYLLMQSELPDCVIVKAAEIAEKSGTKIIFDPSPVRKLPRELLEKVWLFTPNETEIDGLLRECTPKKCVVTLGDKGAKLVECGKETYYPAARSKVRNTTGAGDVFNGALIYALSCGSSLKDAVPFAVKAAAYKVGAEYVTDGFPTIKDIENL